MDSNDLEVSLEVVLLLRGKFLFLDLFVRIPEVLISCFLFCGVSITSLHLLPQEDTKR